jgi:pentatricopeptide repeat protein
VTLAAQSAGDGSSTAADAALARQAMARADGGDGATPLPQRLLGELELDAMLTRLQVAVAGTAQFTGSGRGADDVEEGEEEAGAGRRAGRGREHGGGAHDGAGPPAQATAWVTDSMRSRAPTAPFNGVMVGYFRVGRPDKALRVLDTLEHLGIMPGPETLHALLVGAILSGGRGAGDECWDATAVPASWGGDQDDEAAWGQKAQLQEARARQRVGRALPADAALLRSVAAPGVADVLAQYRAALAAEAGAREAAAAAGAGVAGTGVAPPAAAAVLSVDSPLNDVQWSPAALAEAPWLRTAQGRALAGQLRYFRPWPRDQAARLARVEAAREALGLMQRPADPLAAPAPPRLNDPITASVALLADMLDAAALDAEVAAANDGEGGTVVEGDAPAVIRAAGGGDLLLAVPRLLSRLLAAGVPPDRLVRKVDSAVGFTLGKVSPARTLLATLLLYNTGAWGSLMTCGSASMAAAFPGVEVWDVRLCYTASATVFLHAALSRVAVGALGLQPRPGGLGSGEPGAAGGGEEAAAGGGVPPGGLALLAGMRGEAVMHAELSRVMAVDVTPPLMPHETDRALVLTPKQLETWVEIERARLRLPAPRRGDGGSGGVPWWEY